MHRTIRHRALLTAFALTTLAGCGDSEPTAGAADEPPAPSTAEHIAPTTAAPTAPPTTLMDTTAAPTASVIDGMFDVGGHELYLHCEGTGSPTIIYVHGAISEPDVRPVSNARPIQDRISGTNRFCAYDRRNVGLSDTVDEVQTPDELLADLETLLDVAGVEPPYVLLGASFGGLPAYLYANRHPEHVVGMVLLDAMFPDEFSLEHLFPVEDRYEAFDAEDEASSLERVSHYDMHRAAQEFVGKEPAIPVIYLASEREPWNEQDLGIPEYDAVILDVLAGYVDRFAPGELRWVDSPHFMEPVVPGEIADALRTVIERAS